MGNDKQTQVSDLLLGSCTPYLVSLPDRASVKAMQQSATGVRPSFSCNVSSTHKVVQQQALLVRLRWSVANPSAPQRILLYEHQHRCLLVLQELANINFEAAKRKLLKGPHAHFLL